MPAPTVPLRLTKSESQLIFAGLSLIAATHDRWCTTNELPLANPDLHTGGCKGGRYEPALGQLLTELNERFAVSRFHRARLRLSAFDLAACALAVRVTQTRVRHGHLVPWRKNHALATRKLLLKLEVYRKRAKRAFIEQFGHATFHEAGRRWKQMLVFVRIHLLWCGCHRRIWAPGMRRYFRTVVQDCCGMARTGLKQLQKPIPRDDELHRLVRLALAQVRRRRPDFGIRTLLEHREFAASFLAEFIVKRQSKKRTSPSHNSASTTLPDAATEGSRSPRTRTAQSTFLGPQLKKGVNRSDAFLSGLLDGKQVSHGQDEN